MSSIIDLMIEKGLLSRDSLNQVVSAGQLTEPLHKVAIKTGLISEDDFLNLVQEHLDYTLIKELPEDYDPRAFSGISPAFMEEHKIIPLSLTLDTLVIAASDPFDHLVVDTLKKLYGVRTVEVRLAREEVVAKWISELFLEGEEEKEKEEEVVFADLDDIEQLKDLASEAPVIKKVNNIMTKAVEQGASDVHIESYQDRVLVRFRVDGILHDYETLSRNLQQSIATRIKIMAKLDIAERRLPQDGRVYLRVAGKNVDLRVSCLPTTFGESIVMRILDRSNISFSLDSLGFPHKELKEFSKLIRQPHGILLVTGPTGSGKTTTLYAALNTIQSPDTKIITIEDPVEYHLDGINQVQVNTKAGLTFSGGLRSIVRQDPDVILIGEIRDRETADIAIQSALTGHLVFSTLHTNDAPGAVTRLMEIGVEDYLLASSLIGIMAQRLVRKLCPACKQAVEARDPLLNKIPGYDPEKHVVFQPGGCPKCSGTGYKGRTAIFELMRVTEEIKALILENRSVAAIRDKAEAQGMTLLKHDGWSKVLEGRTSPTEVMRVVGF